MKKKSVNPEGSRIIGWGMVTEFIVIVLLGIGVYLYKKFS
jgi:hypothetical protein